MRVALHTLGCKLNFSESSTLADQLANGGFQPVPFEGESDVFVINTCSVTENADRKCAVTVRQALRRSPDAFVVIIGCYAQLKPAEIAAMPGVDLVLGAAEKFRLTEHLTDLLQKGELQKQTRGADGKACGVYKAGAIEQLDFFSSARSTTERTRSFLKVQDGCDYSCSFCTIPMARGRSRSGSIRQIVQAAEQAASEGITEIVLTGVNIGDFGKNPLTGEQGEERFEDLIRALDEVDGISRFRISSIEPNLLTDSIIDFVSNSSRFTPHFHMPLQSGSDQILALMRRRYRKELYSQRVTSIKKQMPHAAIGADVIVGFPGETETEFEKTYRFLQQLDVSYLHVFPYSERENTVAPQLEGTVSKNERMRRAKMLRILSEKKRRHFYKTFEGQIRPVLLEADNKNGFMHGFTDNYIKVVTAYDASRINSLEHMYLEAVQNDGCMRVQVRHNTSV